MKYAVYVDGFNLYNRRLKDTPYKWLDLKALANNLNLNPGTVELIRYFTARLSPRANDRSIGSRQNTYLRALSTIPELKIHFGQFKQRDVMGELLDGGTRPTNRIVTVRKFEEKGSDVNIASYMIADGFLGLYDSAILISNDSDLSAPMQIVKEVVRKPVGLVSPSDFHMTELSKFASYRRKISDQQLIDSQFPDVLVDPHGSFSKPATW